MCISYADAMCKPWMGIWATMARLDGVQDAGTTMTTVGHNDKGHNYAGCWHDDYYRGDWSNIGCAHVSLYA